MERPSTDRIELAAYAALFALALAGRLIELGDRPFQYDEGQVAYFSWVFATDGAYEYLPLLHGPLTFYLTALGFLVGGDSDFTARLTLALIGSVGVLLPWGLRGQLGRAGALAAAVVLAVSPSFLYFSRFAREDILVTVLGLALLVVCVRLFEDPRRWHPAALGFLLAASFATKETTFITVAVVGAGLIGALVAGWPVLRRLAAAGGRAWAAGALAFVLVFAALFTTFFTHPGGLVDGVYDGPRYWIEQHDLNRGGEGWPFYLVYLPSHEWLVLLAGLAGMAVALRRRHPFGIFLTWLFLASLAVYSYAGERFAWLVLQPLLPLTLLAGIAVQELWERRRAAVARAGLAATAGLAALFAWSAAAISFSHESDPREMVVVVPSTPEVIAVRDRILELDERRGPVSVEIDASDNGSFPWGWYFRHLRTAYVDMNQPGYVPRGDVLIVGDRAHLRPRLRRRLAAYDGQAFRQRTWWERDYSALDPGSWLRWYTQREPWGSLGAVHQWLYMRAP